MNLQLQNKIDLSFDSSISTIPELLSPAGDWLSLIAAVENGADAVYLGGKHFSARRGAKNFTNDEIVRAVEYAHLRDVNIYVAVNIIISDDEIFELADYLIDLYNAGVDALIIQDWGVYEVARKIIPDMPLHTSTQMNIHNSASLQFLKEKGFRRVNLSRELTMDEISLIAETSPVEIEVFIHGALCYCYSGLCYFSSMVSGRSGNRGMCVQACRMPYLIYDENNTLIELDGKNPLSMKDLCSIKLIKELSEMHISALKIEGRMKSPEYVALATSSYRKVLDTLNYMSPSGKELEDMYEELEWQLKEVFNRKFCQGYFKYTRKSDVVSFIRPNHRGVYVGRVISSDFSIKKIRIKAKVKINVGDVIEVWVKEGGRVRLTLNKLKVNDNIVEIAREGEEIEIDVNERAYPGDRIFRVENKPLFDKARKTFSKTGTVRKINTRATAEFRIGKKPLLQFVTDDGFKSIKEGNANVQTAEKKALTKDVVFNCLSRLGSTPYQLIETHLELDENAWLPISEINELRRNIVKDLNDQRLRQYSKITVSKLSREKIENYFFQTSVQAQVKKIKISLLVEDLELLQKCGNLSLDWVYFDLSRRYLWNEETWRKLMEIKSHNKSCRIAIVLPAVIKDQELLAAQVFLADFQDSFDGLVMGNIGWFEEISEFSGKEIIVDSFLNTFNHLTAKLFENERIDKIIISPELTLAQIRKICQFTDIPIEVIAHGGIEVMQTEQNLLSILEDDNSTFYNKTFFLEDSKDYRFPFQVDIGNRTHIYNSKQLAFLKYIPILKEAGVASIKLNLPDYSPKEIKSIINIYRRVCDLVLEGQRDISGMLLEAEKASKSFTDNTTGHLFRGLK